MDYTAAVIRYESNRAYLEIWFDALRGGDLSVVLGLLCKQEIHANFAHTYMADTSPELEHCIHRLATQVAKAHCVRSMGSNFSRSRLKTTSCRKVEKIFSYLCGRCRTGSMQGKRLWSIAALALVEQHSWPLAFSCCKVKLPSMRLSESARCAVVRFPILRNNADGWTISHVAVAEGPNEVASRHEFSDYHHPISPHRSS